MSFELTIATKRDPRDTLASDAPNAPAINAYTLILVSGTFDRTAADAVLDAVSRSCREGASSVLVNLNQSVADVALNLDWFGRGLMSFRGEGMDVQVDAAKSDLYRELSTLATSRDWLVGFTEGTTRGARRAIHVDGPPSDG